MKEEFNLSEHQEGSTKEFFCYSQDNVKEFVTLLKEKILNYPTIKDYQPDEDDIRLIIDKIAGDKLNGN
jgi:hypothetical protein